MFRHMALLLGDKYDKFNFSLIYIHIFVRFCKDIYKIITRCKQSLSMFARVWDAQIILNIFFKLSHHKNVTSVIFLLIVFILSTSNFFSLSTNLPFAYSLSLCYFMTMKRTHSITFHGWSICTSGDAQKSRENIIKNLY